MTPETKTVDPVIAAKDRNGDGHISKENAFKGMLNQKCNEFIYFDKMNLIGGDIIGIKTTRGRPILLDEICEEAYIDLSKNAVKTVIK